MTSRSGAKLPVSTTLFETYRITFRHAGHLLRFGWPWLLALLVISAALYWSLYPSEQAAIAQGGSGSTTLLLSSGLVSAFIGAMLAVPWHRLILLGEVPASNTTFAIDRRKLRYAAMTLLLTAVTVLPFWIISAESVTSTGESDNEGWASAAASLAVFVAMIIYFALLIRLMVALPAIAVDRSDVGFGTAWRATRGNTWRMLLVNIFGTLAPYFVISVAIYSAFTGLSPDTSDVQTTPTRAAFTAWSIATELVAMLVGMLCVTCLSLTFRHFFGADAAARPAEDDAAG